MEKDPLPNQKIVEILSTKSNYKSAVFDKVQEVFNDLKEVLGQISSDLDEALDEVRESGKQLSKRVKLEYRDRGRMDAEIRFADDVLVFSLSPDIYKIDQSHPVYRNPYTTQNEFNAYCGIINIYNFLYDSIRLGREDDQGHLVARIFINAEGFFFVEGREQKRSRIDFYGTVMIDSNELKGIVEDAILYALAFDLTVTSYESVETITVKEMVQKVEHSRGLSGKRLLEATNQSDYIK